MTDNLLTTPAILNLDTSRTCVSERSHQDPDLVRVAQEFEALFYHELLKTMRKTVPEDSGEGFGRSMFNGLLDEELAKSVSSSGTLGVADALIAQFQGDSSQGQAFCVDKSDIEAYQPSEVVNE